MHKKRMPKIQKGERLYNHSSIICLIQIMNHAGFPKSVFRLVEKLLAMVQKQFFLLKGVGLATQELTDEYDNVIETIEKGHEVTWADQKKTTDHYSSEKSLFISFQATSVGEFKDLVVLMTMKL